MASIPHVALLIETSREYGRGLLRGVSMYHRENGPWSIYFEPHGLGEPPPQWLEKWRGDGILARIDDRRMANALLKTSVPVVDLRGALEDLPFPFVGLDNRPIAEMGLKHLESCGLRSFAFCGTPLGENPNQDRRCRYFVELVEAKGKPCPIYCGTQKRRKDSWEREQQAIVDWLESLTKPVGVMTCNDDRGHHVLDACRRAGLRVPDEIAVVSVDNDSHLCNLCTPPMSSIDTNPSRIGFEAAALLDRIMSGEETPETPMFFGPPRGLVPRLSSNVFAVDDPDVAAAVQYIRSNATNGILVSDVIAVVKNAPSTLERKVKKVLGRTIKAEINRVQLEKAKLLLQETDLSVSAISNRCGFSETKYFCEVFRRVTSTTATKYRQQFRH